MAAHGNTPRDAWLSAIAAKPGWRLFFLANLNPSLSNPPLVGYNAKQRWLELRK